MNLTFGIESFFNPHLPVGVDRIDAILTVSAAKASPDAPGQQTQASTTHKAVFFIIDSSGSMNENGKIAQARLAVRKCIDSVNPDTHFGVIAFSNGAKLIVPLAPATPEAKARAHDKVKALDAVGGTFMSRALDLALSEFKKAGDMIRYAMLVTDGENDPDDKKSLGRSLETCEGQFRCDCRGVGTDWRPNELKLIAGKLLGSADAVPDPAELEKQFRDALADAMSKGVADVRLRIQMPKSSTLVTIKQMSPEIVDLQGLAKRVDDKNIDIPLGAWGEESRDYQIAFKLEAQAEGEEMMAGWPKIVVTQDGSDAVTNGQRIVAAWTSDEAQTARIDEHVAHYTGQEELANSIRDGLEAKSRGDIDRATVLLGKAAKIAIETGNDEVTQRLKKVVDVVDASEGTVRLRASNKAADLELDMGGTRTVRRRPAGAPAEVN